MKNCLVLFLAYPLSKTLSGEFSGKLFWRMSEESFATSTTDSIVISDGRFDIKLK